MKHIYFLLVCLLAAVSGFAQEELMIISPGRETFIHFPSAVLGNKHTLTVFLPEKAIPLSKRYPVVYLLGASPNQAAEAQLFLEKHKALVVGIDLQEADYQNQAKIVEFVSRELIPYIDTNYLTFTDASQRFLAAQGKSAALAAIALFAKPNLFGGLALASSGDALEQLTLPAHSARVFVTGRQPELALAQQTLQHLGLKYGKDFALAYASSADGLFDGLDFAYLTAPADEVSLKRLLPQQSGRTLVLGNDGSVALSVNARLNNGRTYVYIPVSLRMSPPYLNWDASRGELTALPGAEPGTVKISGGVDKIGFQTKIKLKKQ